MVSGEQARQHNSINVVYNRMCSSASTPMLLTMMMLDTMLSQALQDDYAQAAPLPRVFLCACGTHTTVTMQLLKLNDVTLLTLQARRSATKAYDSVWQ
jgi:hypothetical protein